MSSIAIQPAERADVPRLTEIYDDSAVNTPVTFDVEPSTVEKRESWFEQFGESGRHRILVAKEGGVVLGYVCTTRFRPKAAYGTEVGRKFAWS